MTVYNLAAVLAFVLFFLACLKGFQWACRPATGGRWSSATYGADLDAADLGPDYSALDLNDFAHRND